MKKFLMLTFLSILLSVPTFAASWQIQEARELYSKGQYEQALTTITNAINSSSKNDPEAYKLRVDIYLELKNKKYMNDAINDINKLLQLTNNKGLYNVRGHINIILGNYQQAAEDFVKSLEQNWPSMKASNTGLIQIAKDTKAPLIVRVRCLALIASIYQDANRNNDALAATFVTFQLISLAPENDPMFKDTSKKNLVEERRNRFKNETQGDLDVELNYALFEYCVGNKELGTKIANGVINEAISRKNTSKANELKRTFNYVKNALDNGLPDNTL